MSRASVPRPITSQVWAPSTSSQTRTQRVQRMQRLWSMPKRSWVASTVALGWSWGSSKWVSPNSTARSWSSQLRSATQTEQTWLRSVKSSSTIRRR